jgi:hypothetical protein
MCISSYTCSLKKTECMHTHTYTYTYIHTHTLTHTLSMQRTERVQDLAHERANRKVEAAVKVLWKHLECSMHDTARRLSHVCVCVCEHGQRQRPPPLAYTCVRVCVVMYVRPSSMRIRHHRPVPVSFLSLSLSLSLSVVPISLSMLALITHTHTLSLSQSENAMGRFVGTHTRSECDSVVLGRADTDATIAPSPAACMSPLVLSQAHIRPTTQREPAHPFQSCRLGPHPRPAHTHPPTPPNTHIHIHTRLCLCLCLCTDALRQACLVDESPKALDGERGQRNGRGAAAAGAPAVLLIGQTTIRADLKRITVRGGAQLVHTQG